MPAFRLSMSLFALLITAMLVLTASTALAADDEGTTSAAYHDLKPSLVSNLTGGPKYIRCDIQLMTMNADNLPQIELHQAALRHELLMLISGQDGPSLKTPDGKESLRKAALTAIQDRLKDLTGDELIDDLYFTSYYVK